MQSKRDNIETMVIDETDEVIEELFESPLQNNLKKVKKSNEFASIMFVYCLMNVMK